MVLNKNKKVRPKKNHKNKKVKKKVDVEWAPLHEDFSFDRSHTTAFLQPKEDVDGMD